jgi:YbbR domain-containing protein
MGWLVRNWHLKLGAVALATILYTGFVYSGTFTERTFPGVPIRDIGQPSGTFLTPQELGTVDIRYRATATVAATAETFDVTVDLSDYDMGRAGEPQALPVVVTSLNEDVTVLGFNPTTVSVTIDPREERRIPVEVEIGQAPEGLIIGRPRLSVQNVTAIGPASVLDQVDHARVVVRIDQSGVAISNQFQLEAVDVRGAVIGPTQGVSLTPETVTVQIDVTPVETTKVVAVRPAVTGTPGVGFAIGPVAVDPPTVTLRGTPDALAPITEVATQAVSIAGLTAEATYEPELVIPAGVRLGTAATTTVTVTVSVEPTDASRTFLVGAACANAPQGAACLPQTDQLAVTLSGPGAALEALSASQLTLILDVAGLGPGTHQVTPAVPALPDGVELVGISPGSVTVVIQPAATPTPAPPG